MRSKNQGGGDAAFPESRRSFTIKRNEGGGREAPSDRRSYSGGEKKIGGGRGRVRFLLFESLPGKRLTDENGEGGEGR